MSTVYQNQDLDLNKFFVKRDHSAIVTDIKSLKYNQLSRDIYFRPSNAPIVNIADVNAGSCFDGYYVPTGSYKFYQAGSRITVEQEECDLTLLEYADMIWTEMGQSIKHIYDCHPEVTLCYSGGIDSMVVLSYLMAYGFLPRTRVISFENHTQNDKECLQNNVDKRASIVELLDSLPVKSTSWARVTDDDIAHGFNYQNLANFKCYATNSLLRAHQDTAFLFGFHGNQALLHKACFVDELILNNPDNVNAVRDYFLTNKDFYTQSLVNYDINKEKIGVARTHMLQKPWACLDHMNGNRVYGPIANDRIFQALRKLDFSNISVDTIADAKLARELINRNVGSQLDQYIITEGLSDNDILKDSLIPLSKLNLDLLTIPPGLTHNQEGVDYINYEINNAHASGAIAINALAAVKMLQWVDSL